MSLFCKLKIKYNTYKKIYIYNVVSLTFVLRTFRYLVWMFGMNWYGMIGLVGMCSNECPQKLIYKAWNIFYFVKSVLILCVIFVREEKSVKKISVHANTVLGVVDWSTV